MNNKPAKKISNKILIPAVIAFFVIVAGGILAWNMLKSDADVVIIHKNDEIIEEIDLSDVEKPYTIDLGTNVVYVEKDGVSMKSAKCPDKICVHTGKIDKNGEAIVCAPNKIMIEFKGKDDKVDAVAGGR